MRQKLEQKRKIAGIEARCPQTLKIYISMCRHVDKYGSRGTDDQSDRL